MPGVSRLTRGHGFYFGVVVRDLCFEVIVTKLVAEKAFR